ncbi:phosphate acyltransferase PlsX [Pyramidobacter sp. SM-530-WT-4B]|uniref:Phosphate acyltransferase n=1 Tax=Pyramidobacter porci TaxID=2605789 RepID=A0A6L5YEX5_9BACT|nr:phosphate acyltransferase PlsX [Pyramidobacter porci]MST56162.1 phosphate acyltransferase PlsX [Pyramidobacter porci]
MIIAVDAMGGDHGASAVCPGVIEACNRNSDLEIALIGDKTVIEPYLDKADGSVRSRIHVVHAEEVVDPNESPAKAIRCKKHSSMRIAMEMVRSGEAKGCVSSGSTGAIVAGGVLVVGRLKGIDRPGLGILLPTKKPVFLLDAGATVRCKPLNLVQFSLMGSVYMKDVEKLSSSPRVCLLSNGSEEIKGDDVIVAARERLRASDDLNFGGYVEANRVPMGDADVVVCDGFSGNVMLKSFEGLIKFCRGLVKETIQESWLAKAGALLLYPSMKRLGARVDYQRYGGSALMGVNGAVIKAHGRSKAPAIANAIGVAYSFVERNALERIREDIAQELEKVAAEETLC